MHKTGSIVKAILFGALLGVFVQSAGAAERGTPAEAQAMVKKAVVYLKQHGRDQAAAAFNEPTDAFADRDLYIWMMDDKGLMHANGGNRRLAGKDLIDLKDADGQSFTRAMLEKAKTDRSFWHDYKWLNPTTRQIEAKSSYVEVVGDLLIGCGVYRAKD